MSNKWNHDKHVAIIGAGFGGIVAALRLKKIGFTNFTIYEKANEVGGAWRDNTYPGCSCDVSAQWYSISSDLNPDWSHTFVSQPEILEYQKSVVTKNGLRPHLQLNSMLVGGTWDDSRQGYSLSIEAVDPSTGQGTGNVETVFADVLVKATGGSWSVPKLPTEKEFPGLSTFKGEVMHSSGYKTDMDLKGKRVGVVGNAASGCQIVPVIAEDPTTQVVNFGRTQQWFVTRPQTEYSALRKWIYRNVPLVQKLDRFGVYARYDVMYAVIPNATRFVRPAVQWYFSNYMKSVAPKHLHEELTPDDAFGCRRAIRDPNYYKALNQPNVSLEWDHIRGVTPTGVIVSPKSSPSDTREIPLDVLITAIGFDTTSEIALPLIGRDGVTMKDYWTEKGGPTAYRGTTMPFFPNMFTLLGPNSGAGHASVVFFEEVQADYMIKMLTPILKKGSKMTSVEVSEQACDTYNDELQNKISHTVWATCSSYYNQFGGKNVALFPGMATAWWWNLAWPVWGDYIVKSEDVVSSQKKNGVALANGNGNGNGAVKHGANLVNVNMASMS